MYGQEINRKLNVLIIDQNIEARSTLKDMLATRGQSDVELMKDGRDLVGRELSFKFDLIFVRDDLGYALGGADLIRYLTRSNLVPRWCKFVLMVEDAESIAATPIFRHLRTEIWDTAINYQMVDSVISSTEKSLDVFQGILKKLNHMPASTLISKIKDIDSSQFDQTHKDELLELKIKLLLQGRRPDLAWDISEKISYSSDKYREQLFISFSTGQSEKYHTSIKNSAESRVLDKGCIYYQTYKSYINGEKEMALMDFQKLDDATLHPNEMEANALLLLKAQGLTKAIEYLDHKLEIKTDGYDLKNFLTLSQIKCYLLALMAGDIGGQSKEQVNSAMIALVANNTWSRGSFRYNIYKPFILMAMATLQGRSVDSTFEKLYRYRHQLDVTQLSILLFVANKLALEEQSWEVLKMLDRNAARLEMSPELISHEVCYRDVMGTTLDNEKLAQKVEDLGDLHKGKGRLYRALGKYYNCRKLFGHTQSLNRKMAAIMRELRIDSYWEIAFSSLVDSKGEESDVEVIAA